MSGTAAPPARVLVVEDFPQLRDLLMRGLSGAGFVVEGAGSVAQARELGPDHYDALVVDHRLGDAFGADLLTELIDQQSEAAHRFILITGEDRDLGLPVQVPVLVKPFAMDTLVGTVRNVVTGDAPASDNVV